MATTPKQHIEEIRRNKFSIEAKDPNPLTEDLHQAVKNLSAELYAKDVHFLMELIQNAEDNEYGEGVDPSLEFVITSNDITGQGASSTLIIFNNEKGFSPKNIESICSVGRSTKKNNRMRGYIGEKGIGFKSVFLITSCPYIFSNGYQIRFNESPCPVCNVGYIVPQWVDSNPILAEIKSIHGSGSTLPATTIVLPLKPDKVPPVKKQLSSVHPELLLFLSKIRKLSVREEESTTGPTAVKAISISSEINFVTRKNVDAESFLLHLSADVGPECSYHMWRQRFPTLPDNRVERRSDVEEFSITLAFPNGERPHVGPTSPGIYAFLPTEMVTGFPFIIQADFLLASSRETILLDSPWNRAILECVPSAFSNAFISLVKETHTAPHAALPRMFRFLPVESSPYPLLNSSVREPIRSKMMEESIIPCESYTQQRFFHRPGEIGRLKPTFWNVLKMAREQGVCLDNILTHGKYVLSSAFDNEECDSFLNFLKVGSVGDEWYARCIQSSNLVLGGSEGLYLELLLFAAENWRAFSSTILIDVPLIKYEGPRSQVILCTPKEASCRRVCLLMCSSFNQISWLTDWNAEFLGVNNRFFLPQRTQRELFYHPKRHAICDWLVKNMNATSVSVYEYALKFGKEISKDRKHAVTYAHFLFHSTPKYLSEAEVPNTVSCMNLVNNYGQVTESWKGVLVPANGSRWVQLVGFNPWRDAGYVELCEDYMLSGSYAGGAVTREKELIPFLKSYVKASDLPDLAPPNVDIPSFYSVLTKENALLLLQWVKKMNGTHMPDKFRNCVKNGSWLRVLLGTSTSSKPPSQSFFFTSSCELLSKNGSVLVDMPFVDQRFYGKEISDYREELRRVGVKSEFSEASEYIGDRYAILPTLTRAQVYSILNFIRFLRNKLLPPDSFINRIKDGRWLRTTHGDRSPGESVLYDPDWEAASHISDIPFIDHCYYGPELNSYGEELHLLGVIVGCRGKRKLVHDKLKSPSRGCSYQAAKTVLLLLECRREYSSSDKLLKILRDSTRLKTNKGYKPPAECYLFDTTWGCLLQVFDSFALIDTEFYGKKILSFRKELAGIGVLMDFEGATKAFAGVFKHRASSSSISRDSVLLFLACCKKFKAGRLKFPADLEKCIEEAKWLRTRLTDYRPPSQCILPGPEWASISSISTLPFIDDGENYYGKKIHEYEAELQALGVVVSFKSESGAKLLASSLRLPQNPNSITAAATCSLLKCIRTLKESSEKLLIETLVRKATQAWIKTRAGYRAPNESMLFCPDWDSFLSCEDGPFMDETFYGTEIRSYSEELKILGVVVVKEEAEKKEACLLLAAHIEAHTNDFTAIKRIYSFLNGSKWRPAVKDAVKIWIPNGFDDDGQWVTCDECVLHDKDGLFGRKFHVLDAYYEKELLSFFPCTLHVKASPCLDDYRKLWMDWEDSGHQLSSTECLAFWSFVVNHWGPKARKDLSESFRKLPVFSGSSGILLVDKQDVFIPDDLYLNDLFECAAARPLFAWWPRPSTPALPRHKLLDIFTQLGARSLSESVTRGEQSAPVAPAVAPTQRSSSVAFVRKRGFIKLILGFLAGLEIEAGERHSAAKGLLEATVIEVTAPFTVEYGLPLASGEVVRADARGLMRWERDTCRFYMHVPDGSGGFRDVLEHGTCFATVVAEGLLWDREDQIGRLAEVVKLGFVLEFDEEAVEFLMKTKNLQVFLEDEEFLSSAVRPSC